MYAIDMSGNYAKFKAHPIMCKIAQALIYIVRLKTTLAIKHVYAHKGEPHNELVQGIEEAEEGPEHQGAEHEVSSHGSHDIPGAAPLLERVVKDSRSLHMRSGLE